MTQAKAGVKDEGSKESGPARFRLALADWNERWFRRTLVFALLGIVFSIN